MTAADRDAAATMMTAAPGAARAAAIATATAVPAGSAAAGAMAAARGSEAATRGSEAATRSIGMAVVLGAVTMAFATLLLAYAIVRVQAPAWPPPGEPPMPRAWAWLVPATLAAIAASAAMTRARRAASRAGVYTHAATNANANTMAPPATVRRALGMAVLAGLLFVAIQARAWWWLAVDVGVRPSAGLVSSVVYALTLFHAAHAVAGVLLTLPALVRAGRGRAVRASTVAALASFWHFVAAAWIVIVLAVFVA